jgi:hypothetical protein
MEGGEVARRSSLIGIAIFLFVAVLAAVAVASEVTGQGKTPLNAALGMNVKSDLSGQLTYNSDPNGATPDFWAQCDSFHSYTRGTNLAGFPVVRVTAACTDGNGIPVYLRASFTDRGEPGTSDSVCIIWTYQKVFPKQSNAYIHDDGTILDGNIQFHDNGDGTTTLEMVSST